MWIDFEEFDTTQPVLGDLPENCFEQIALDYLATGQGRQGTIGAATSYLFEASELVRFAVKWLEVFASEQGRH
jgi:aminoglycoside 3-N-acetyltransferase